VNLGQGFYIKMQPAWIAEADRAAAKRQAQADRLERKPGNNLVATADDALAISVLGCRTERATLIWFARYCIKQPIVWNSYLEERDLRTTPDIVANGVPMDVKGIRENRLNLIVKNQHEHDLMDDWAYPLVSTEDDPYYWFPGWRWGREIRRVARKVGGARPMWLAEKGQLHSLRTLIETVKAAASDNS
jgi:hypothetical protein